MKNSRIIKSFFLLVCFTIFLGVVYPFFVQWIGNILFASKVVGSPIIKEGKIVALEYIGESYQKNSFFWGRPQNEEEKEERKQYYEDKKPEIPIDLITCSASKQDSYISQEAAYFQVERIKEITGLEIQEINDLIEKETRNNIFLEKPMVNVNKLNVLLMELVTKEGT